jgi:DNA-binding NarL/FixJ family response regulator
MTTQELADAIAALAAMEPADRARAAKALADAARTVLAAERRQALADAVGQGWSIAALARELGVHRSKIDDALAEHRRSSE